MTARRDEKRSRDDHEVRRRNVTSSARAGVSLTGSHTTVVVSSRLDSDVSTVAAGPNPT